MENEIKKVITGNYCIGCGVCAALSPMSYEMEFDHEGKYSAKEKRQVFDDPLTAQVCPFAEVIHNEDTIGYQLFGSIANIQHDAFLGCYLKTYAGSVSSSHYREKGSSGGFGSWLASMMLEQGLIDYVLHIRPSNTDKVLFSYMVSSSPSEVSEGSKSKYYPVEMSSIISHVRKHPGKYLLLGVPCFIKAIRLLAFQDTLIKERIVFTVGLVCGHLKTDRFAKTIAWQLGIQPDVLQNIDFRVKLPNKPAGSYGVKVTGEVDNKIITHTSPMRDTIVSNWGHGLFRYNACDYCDDVLAECADITIGDAWLPEYVNDEGGTNIIIVRNPRLAGLFTDFKEELSIEEISAEKVYQSQAGGFRHRREGLAYRLFLKDQNKEWRPKKRVEPNNTMTKKRKKIYHDRILLLDEGNRAYEKALEANDFTVFERYMTPILNSYNKLYRRSFVRRVASKVRRAMSNIIVR